MYKLENVCYTPKKKDFTYLLPLPSSFQRPNPTVNQFDQIDNQDLEIVDDMLGQGKFGKVQKVKYRKNQQIYALKIFDKSQVQQQNTLKSIENEIQINYLMDHPCIIKLYTHFEDFDNIYLLFELAEGGTLLQKIEKTKECLNEKLCIKYMRQICDAFDYIQNFSSEQINQTIIHRDIKTENILLDSLGNVKLSDFGEANLLNNTNNSRQTFTGTPHAIAPEIFWGKQYDESVDIFSLGITLYELLSKGKNPFIYDENELQCLEERERLDYWKKAITKNEPVFDQNITQSLLKKMLEKDPSKRITIKQIKKDAWLLQDIMSFQQNYIEETIEEIENFRKDYFDQKLSLIQHSNIKESEQLQSLQCELKDLDDEILNSLKDHSNLQKENDYIINYLTNNQDRINKQEMGFFQDHITISKVKHMQEEDQKLNQIINLLKDQLLNKDKEIYTTQKRLENGSRIYKKMELYQQEIKDLDLDNQLLVLKQQKEEQEMINYELLIKKQQLQNTHEKQSSYINRTSVIEQDMQQDENYEDNQPIFSGSNYNSNIDQQNIEDKDIPSEFIVAMEKLNRDVKEMQEKTKQMMTFNVDKRSSIKQQKNDINLIENQQKQEINQLYIHEIERKSYIKQIKKLEQKQREEMTKLENTLVKKNQEYLIRLKEQKKLDGLIKQNNLIEKSISEIQETYDQQQENSKNLQKRLRQLNDEIQYLRSLQ